MRVLFYFIISAILIPSCKIEKPNIHDIWVGDYEKTIYFDEESIGNSIPYLLDLREADLAKIKYLPGREIETTWNLLNNILTIDSVEYRLISLSNDSLVYSPYMEELEKPTEVIMEEDEVYEVPIKDTYLVFKRINKVNIPIAKDSIHKILSNKIWINEKVKGNKSFDFADWIEFLDNGIALMKMDVDFGQDGKIEKHIQSEGWSIETYGNYKFLVFATNHIYSKGFQGNINAAFQITHLDSDNIEFDYFLQRNQKVYSLYNPSDKVVQNNHIYGNWISKNDSSKYLPKPASYSWAPKDETVQIFNGELKYELKKDTLKIIPNKFNPVICNWRINSDGTIFIYEYEVKNEYSGGYYVEYANFEMKSDDIFELELFSNDMHTGLEKPRIILFNKFQTFERIK